MQTIDVNTMSVFCTTLVIVSFVYGFVCGKVYEKRRIQAEREKEVAAKAYARERMYHD